MFSPQYYAEVQRSNVSVETGAIVRVEAQAIRMEDGAFHRPDALILATGFKVDQFVRPAKIIGEDCVDLDTMWQPNPHAYYAVTVPRLPNFFLVNGPTGPVGNFSLIDIAEKQWNYIDQLIELIRNGVCKAVAPTETALQNDEGRRSVAARGTVFATGCTNWYLSADGTPQVWPWSYGYFLEAMAHPRLEDDRLA